jgi:hypothetical protein
MLQTKRHEMNLHDYLAKMFGRSPSISSMAGQSRFLMILAVASIRVFGSGCGNWTDMRVAVPSNLAGKISLTVCRQETSDHSQVNWYVTNLTGSKILLEFTKHYSTGHGADIYKDAKGDWDGVTLKPGETKNGGFRGSEPSLWDYFEPTGSNPIIRSVAMMDARISFPDEKHPSGTNPATRADLANISDPNNVEQTNAGQRNRTALSNNSAQGQTGTASNSSARSGAEAASSGQPSTGARASSTSTNSTYAPINMTVSDQTTANVGTMASGIIDITSGVNLHGSFGFVIGMTADFLSRGDSYSKEQGNMVGEFMPWPSWPANRYENVRVYGGIRVTSTSENNAGVGFEVLFSEDIDEFKGDSVTVNYKQYKSIKVSRSITWIDLPLFLTEQGDVVGEDLGLSIRIPLSGSLKHSVDGGLTTNTKIPTKDINVVFSPFLRIGLTPIKGTPVIDHFTLQTEGAYSFQTIPAHKSGYSLGWGLRLIYMI